jgi:hypothetical protein
MSRLTFENKLTMGTVITLIGFAMTLVAGVVTRENDIATLGGKYSKQSEKIEEHERALSAIATSMAVRDEQYRNILETLKRIETTMTNKDK